MVVKSVACVIALKRIPQPARCVSLADRISVTLVASAMKKFHAAALALLLPSRRRHRSRGDRLRHLAEIDKLQG